MINFDAVDFSEHCSEEMVFLLMLSVVVLCTAYTCTRLKI